MAVMGALRKHRVKAKETQQQPRTTDDNKVDNRRQQNRQQDNKVDSNNSSRSKRDKAIHSTPVVLGIEAIIQTTLCGNHEERLDIALNMY